jgi:radical SAM protein with 4Fe4S-binding SPASM domain
MRPYLPADAVHRHAENDRVLVVNPATRRWVATNQAGWSLLKLCDGSRSIDDICSDFEAPPDRRALIDNTLRGLLAAGVIRLEGDASKDARPSCGCEGPRSLHLEITNRCNLQCVHCYVSAGRKEPDELTFSEICAIVDEFARMSTGTPGPVAITGGEARLRPDCLEVIGHCRGLGLDTVLFTDAVGMPSAFAAQLAVLGARAQVSLDGPDPGTNDPVRGKGTYSRIVAGIQTLLDHGLGPTMTLFVTLTRGSVDRAMELVEQAEKWGLGRIHFSQLNGQGRAKRDWTSMAPTTAQWISFGNLMRKRTSIRTRITGNVYGGLQLDENHFPMMKCQIPSSPRIDCQGNVYPCQLFAEKQHRIGNIRVSSLSEILSSSQTFSVAEAASARSDQIDRCRSCDWKALCYSGCPGHAYSEFGTLLHEDSLCDVRLHWFAQTASEILAAADVSNEAV